MTYSDDTYCFDKDNKVMIDGEEFERLIDAAKSYQDERDKIQILKEGIALYRDDPLPDCCYEDWAVQVREHYKDLLITTLIELIASHEKCQDWTEIIGLSKLVLEKDSFNEPVCLSYMKALAQIGQEAEALRFYESFSQRLERELGVLPSQELKNFHDRLLNCRKRVTWIITIETNQMNEVNKALNNLLRKGDEVKTLSGEKIGVFIKDVDREVAESIKKRIEESFDRLSIPVKISLRLAR